MGAESTTQIGNKKKIAFVCSGGGAKAGAFHLGVALALQEQGFRFYGGMTPQAPASPVPPGPMDISTYVGSSAGSIISTYLAAGYSLENIFNSYLGRKSAPLDPADLLPKPLPRLSYQKMFKLRPAVAKEQLNQLSLIRGIITGLMDGNFEALTQFQWLKATGLFSTAGIEQYIREEVLTSNRFEDCLADLFIVGTQLNHSRKVVFGKYSYLPPPDDLSCQYSNDVTISDACAASTALPGIFAPYGIKDAQGKVIHYIDGEIRDTLSTHVAVDAGADLVFASYTHQPFHADEGANCLTQHGLPAILVQSIYLLVEQKIKQTIHANKCKGAALSAVSRYCKDQGISEEHRKMICDLLEGELNYRSNVDFVYIHPTATDREMFFNEHFSLSSQKMTEVVKSGFRAAIDTLKKYEFADRRRDPAIGVAGGIAGVKK